MYEHNLIYENNVFLPNQNYTEQEKILRQEGIVSYVNPAENYLEENLDGNNFFVKSYNAVIDFLFNRNKDDDIREIVQSKLIIRESAVPRNSMLRTSQFSAFYTYSNVCSTILTNFKHSPHFKDELYEKLHKSLEEFLIQAYKISKDSSNMQKGYK